MKLRMNYLYSYVYFCKQTADAKIIYYFFFTENLYWAPTTTTSTALKTRRKAIIECLTPLTFAASCLYGRFFGHCGNLTLTGD